MEIIFFKGKVKEKSIREFLKLMPVATMIGLNL